MAGSSAKTKQLMYKGFPLRRVGNYIYYGRMADRYIVQMSILKSEKQGDIDIPSQINIQLQDNSPGLSGSEKVSKDAMRTSLFEAIDVGEKWLRKALLEAA